MSIFLAAETDATADVRITAFYCRSMPAFLLVVSLCGVLAKVGGIMLAGAVLECHQPPRWHKPHKSASCQKDERG
ncbi:hypothetical protein D3C77_238680 [compost metagenome]